LARIEEALIKVKTDKGLKKKKKLPESYLLEPPGGRGRVSCTNYEPPIL